MKYIKFIVPLAMVFYLPFTFKSQDSTSIHDLFYKKQQGKNCQICGGGHGPQTPMGSQAPMGPTGPPWDPMG